MSRAWKQLGCLKQIAEQLDRIEHHVHQVLRFEEQIMSNQEHLDASVAELGAQFQQVVDEVQALKDQVAAGGTLDFTALDAAVQTVADAVPDVTPEG